VSNLSYNSADICPFIGSVDGLANELALLGLGDSEVAIVFEVGDVKDRKYCLRQ